MAPKKAVRDLKGWELLEKIPDELRLSFKLGSKSVQRSLYSGSAYISREECFRLAMCIPEVSQFHALIEWDDKTKKWKIKDQDSTGGTKVNGRKVRSDRCTGLKTGDKISISGVVTIAVEVVPVPNGTGEERFEAFLRSREHQFQWQGEQMIKDVKTKLEDVHDKVISAKEALEP